MKAKLHAEPRDSRTRVFVVDDHPIVRQGLAQLINQEADLIVCGEAGDSVEALQMMASLKPDIVIADVSLRGGDGIELVKNIRMQDPDLPVLVLSMHDETLYAERALRAGARGYIMKQEPPEQVMVALRQVRSREIYLSESMGKRMLQQIVGGSHPAGSPIERLSDRELEVFRLIGQGHGTRQIAEELHVSVKTVESYRAHIKEKMLIGNAYELVQHAVQWLENEKGR